MNTVTVKIQNEQGSWEEQQNVSLPFKYGKILDEQLDYAVVELTRTATKIFPPLTKVEISIKNVYDEKENGVDEEIMYYFVATDNFMESPVGSGQYTHTLTLVELTKFLECFPVETLCFTNARGNDYTSVATEPELITTTET